MWRSKRIGGRRSGRNPQPLVSTVSTVHTSGACTDKLSDAAASASAVNASDLETKSKISIPSYYHSHHRMRTQGCRPRLRLSAAISVRKKLENLVNEIGWSP